MSGRITKKKGRESEVWGRASVKDLTRRLHRDPSIISLLYPAYAADRDQKIETLLRHSAVKGGPIEIRPADDLAEMIRDGDRRRGTQTRGGNDQ